VLRKNQKFIETWLVRSNRKPLVIRGARQVGKSTLVRQSISHVKLELMEVNCEQNPQLDAVFKTLNISKIIDELESLPGKKPIQENTVIFLDEVQATPHALAALRYFFEERPDIKIICAGSLLEFALAEHDFSMPVGRIEFLHIVPMDFEEFLQARAEHKLLHVLQTFTLDNPPSDAQHQRLLELQKQYCFVGGMPEAVREYCQEQRLSAARSVHDAIIETYKTDFAKYGLKQDLPRLAQVLDHAAQRVAKRVKFTHLLAETQSKTIRRLLALLIQARLLSVVTHSDASDIPLGADMRSEVFKLLLVDVGLLNALLQMPWKDLNVESALMSVRDGSIAEQFVGQELIASIGSGKQELHFWLRDGKSVNAEVDYLVIEGGRIVPIEVKAGKSGSLRSLRIFCELRRSKFALRFDANPPSIQEISYSNDTPNQRWSLISLPLYAACQIERLLGQ
jgi:predicted AAA+ superfamily ATPase